MVVLRLCTSEKEVIDYWDHIDGQLELNLDVLDDLIGEGEQIMKKNGWLNYSEPIQRFLIN